MKKSNPSVSVIIVHYHVEKELFALLSSLKKQPVLEIIVVDNDEKPTIEKKLQQKFRDVIYIANKKNLGFGEANNIGAKKSIGEYLFFLNPDTDIKGNTVEKLVTFLEQHSDAGVAAPLLYHPDGSIFDNQGVRTLTPLRALFSTSFIHRLWPSNPIAKDYWMKGFLTKKDREVDIVPGTAFMIRRELFKKVGGFDPKFFLYFEEFDLCRRIRDLGLKLYMVSGTHVTHIWEVSTRKRNDKDEIFRESQRYYFQKYYGKIIASFFTYLLTFDMVALLFVLALLTGIVLRLYKVTSLFMYIGDFGWFYLSAYNLITKGIIPLVSIPSSVVWLHQGPLATYFIALALFISHMNPVAPAVFFSVLDIFTIVLVYVLGKKLENRILGVTAAFLYATFPLVLINVRMPYHTSAIPFFISSVMLLTLTVLEKKKYYFWLFFLTGLLLQLELSNGIIFLIFFLMALFYRKELRFSKRILGESVVGLLLGILPFILYDITHHFIQTIGFPLWVINRVRLFLGLTTAGNATTGNLPNALITIWEHIARILFPYSQVVVTIIILCIFFTVGMALMRKKRQIFAEKAFILLLLWIGIPLLSFIIHAAPGDAYFPFLFPSLALITAYAFVIIYRKRVVLLLVTICIGLFNAGFTLNQDYFLSTASGSHPMPPGKYSFGPAFYIHDIVAQKIMADAGSTPFTLKVGKRLGIFATGADHFRFLLLTKGANLGDHEALVYTIYDVKETINASESIIYQNAYFTVTKRQYSMLSDRRTVICVCYN